MPFVTDTFLRRAERDDMDRIVAWMSDPEFQRFLFGDPARSPRLLREQLTQMLGRTAPHVMPGAIYLVLDSPEHGPLGFLALQHISWRNRSCSLDVYLGDTAYRDAIAAGIATFRALEYCFDELNLHRVSAYIYAFNRRSWRILEMTGAKRELVLTKHVLRDGELHDLYGYGLLQHEFAAFRDAHRDKHGVSLEGMIEKMRAAAEAEP